MRHCTLKVSSQYFLEKFTAFQTKKVSYFAALSLRFGDQSYGFIVNNFLTRNVFVEYLTVLLLGRIKWFFKVSYALGDDVYKSIQSLIILGSNFNMKLLVICFCSTF